MPFTSSPKEMNNLSLLGLAAAAGIGFTVSLFITNLAFEDFAVLADESKIGILFASVVAGILGLVLLHFGTRSTSSNPDQRAKDDSAGKEKILS